MGWLKMPQRGRAIAARPSSGETRRRWGIVLATLVMGLATRLPAGAIGPRANGPGTESPVGMSSVEPRPRPARDEPAIPTLVEEVTLEAGRERVEPWFGRAVAVAGTSVVVASPRDGDGGTAQGVAHVFGDSKRGWRRVQRLQSADPSWEDRFAQAIAADKGRLVVGRDRADEGTADAGAVTVFRRTGYHFKREAEILPPEPGSGDGFGGAVAISGSVIVVGASRDDDGGLDAGTATVWEWADGAWSLQARLASPDPASGDWFGAAVAVDGVTVAVGAYGEDDRGEKSGAVYLFRREGGAWTLEMKLAPEDLAAGDWFGFSLALAGDTLAIGAPRDDVGGESSGSVRIFRRQRDGWRLEETLRPSEGSTAPWFGYSVALDGQRLLVGIPGDDRGGESAGAAALYERTQGRWLRRADLAPSSPRADELFGSAVAMRGDFAAVGRLVTEDGEITAGRAWVFRLGGTPKREIAAPRSTSVPAAPPAVVPGSAPAPGPERQPGAVPEGSPP